MLRFILSLLLLSSSLQGLMFPGVAAVGIIGSADGPSAVFVASDLATNAPVFMVSPIDDSTFGRINGSSWKPGCPVAIADLRLLAVSHVDFDGRVRKGELICHRLVADELCAIFEELFEAGFPIASLMLIDDYGADDLLSMDANNSSSFNYRTISGSASLSRHAYGLAVDINPVQNPYVEGGGEYVSPEAGRAYLDRGDVRPGMVVPGNAAHKAFKSRGWTWGGDWKYQIDYQHFQKTVK